MSEIARIFDLMQQAAAARVEREHREAMAKAVKEKPCPD